MVKLYHYTNYEGLNGIKNTGYIRAQRPHGGAVDLPFGVYLTKLTPDTDSITLIINNYEMD